jgi:integrase
MALSILKTRLASKSYSKSAARHGAWYLQWCRDNHTCPFPAKHTSVGGYILWYVRKNDGSTRSIDYVLSSLARYSKEHSLRWLSKTERHQLKLITKQLKYDDVRPTNQKEPLTLDLLIPIFAKWGHNPDRLKLITAMFLGHDTLLRSAELLALRISDLKWLDTLSIQICIRRTKSNQAGPSQTVTLHDRPGPSSLKLLKSLLQTFGLSTSGPQAFIFHQDGLANLPLPRTWLCNGIKASLTSIGVNPACYSTHSLRAGGATDLLRANVPIDIIKKAGRWNSDEVLKYLRDESFLARSCATAFTQVSNGGLTNMPHSHQHR